MRKSLLFLIDLIHRLILQCARKGGKMKDLKVTLLYVVNILMGILTYVFLSQPYMSTTTMGSGLGLANQSGYDIIDSLFTSSGGTGTEVMLALSTFLVSIFAGVLIIASIYNLLVSFDVVKNSKFTKVANIVNLVATAVLVAFGVIALSCDAANINNTLVNNVVPMENLYNVGWAVIVNLVMAVIALVSSVLGYLFSKKSA